VDNSKNVVMLNGKKPHHQFTRHPLCTELQLNTICYYLPDHMLLPLLIICYYRSWSPVITALDPLLLTSLITRYYQSWSPVITTLITYYYRFRSPGYIRGEQWHC